MAEILFTCVFIARCSAHANGPYLSLKNRNPLLLFFHPPSIFSLLSPYHSRLVPALLFLTGKRSDLLHFMSVYEFGNHLLSQHSVVVAYSLEQNLTWTIHCLWGTHCLSLPGDYLSLAGIILPQMSQVNTLPRHPHLTALPIWTTLVEIPSS